MSVASRSLIMSRIEERESSQDISEIKDEDIEIASQSTSIGTVPLEKDSQSQTSKKSIKSARKELSSKATHSEKSSRASRVRSNPVDEVEALVLSSGRKYLGKTKERPASTGKGASGKQNSVKSSASKSLAGFMISKSKTGESLLDEWKDRGLSSDEMRDKLFASFKSKGILNGAKLQIRADLASVINERQILNMAKKSKVVSFAAKISDCIVAEHLKKSEYEYSLSVFKAESLLSDFEFHPHEILDIMKLSPTSKVYHNLMMSLSQVRCKSFLWNFISEMISGKNVVTVSTESQTEECIPLSRRVISSRMSEIEKDVVKTGDSPLIENYLSLEEKLFDMQQKMESQKKRELSIEKKKVRDELLREIRLEEQEKSNFELEKHKSELEKLYREMFANLKDKERQMDIAISQKRKQLEEEAYDQRQSLLEELKRIKERESEMQKQHEIAMTSVNLEEAKLRSLAEELKVKEMSQRTVEERFEIKFQQEMLNYKTEQQQERQKFEEFYKQQELKLNEEKALFQSEKASLVNYKNEFETVKNRNAQLQQSLHSSQQQVYILNQKIADMKEKLHDISDYPKLKEKVLLKEKEIDYLKKSLNEIRNDRSSIDTQHRKDMKELIDKFLKSTPETAKLQQQNLIEREEFLEREKELKLKYREIAKQLQEENLKNMEIVHMYEECMLQNKALKREIEDLKQAGSHIFVAQNPYGNTLRPFEYKNAKGFPPSFQPYTSKRPTLDAESDKQMKGQAIHIDKAVSAPQETSLDHEVSSNILLASNEIAQRSEEWAAFERLERESATLEQMYHNFKAEKNFIFSRESDFERPSTNDFRPLQKYESSLKQDLSAMFQEAEKDSIFETTTERHLGRNYPSSQVLGYASEMKSGHSSSYAMNFKVKSGNVKNLPKNDKVVSGILNDQHMTEYLPDSVGTGNQEGDMLQGLDARSRVFKVRDSIDKRDDLNSMEVPKSTNDTVGGSDSTHVVKQGWDEQERVAPLVSKIGSAKRSDNKTFIIGPKHAAMTNESGEEDFGSKYNGRGIMRKDIVDVENKPSVEIPSLIEEERFDESSVESKRDSQLFEEEYNKEKILSRSMDSQLEEDALRIDHDERSSSTKEADDDVIAGAAESHGRHVNSEQNDGKDESKDEGKSEGDGEDDHIDPLMKRYMEMVMKAKNMPDGEKEKDQSNLTDDIKIESKLSRSDVSDLVEDKIEEIQVDSADDFDW